MVVRKIFCGVVEGVVYDDRCLFKLSQILEGNKTCEGCILREIEKMESEKTKRVDRKDTRGTKGIRKGRRRIKASPGKKPSPIQDEGPMPVYKTQELVHLLGKSERDIRRWAEEGKIPAHKVGRGWRFPKEEFDRWLSEKGYRTDIVPAADGHSNDVVMTTNTASQGEDVTPPDQNDGGST